MSAEPYRGANLRFALWTAQKIYAGNDAKPEETDKFATTLSDIAAS
jgi:hypothetical protein